MAWLNFSISSSEIKASIMELYHYITRDKKVYFLYKRTRMGCTISHFLNKASFKLEIKGKTIDARIFRL